MARVAFHLYVQAMLVDRGPTVMVFAILLPLRIWIFTAAAPQLGSGSLTRNFSVTVLLRLTLAAVADVVGLPVSLAP